MAKQDSSAVKPSAHIEETCPYCGTRYEYNSQAFEKTAPPCTACGMSSQAWQAAVRRQPHHILTIGTAAVLLIIMLLTAMGAVSIASACPVAGWLAILSLAGHFLIAVWPSKKGPATLAEITALARSGNLVHVKTDESFLPPQAMVSLGLPWKQLALFAIAGCLAGGIFWAEIARRSHGWILNSSINNAVVGPGDSFTMYFSPRSSVDGQWEVYNGNLEIKLPRGRKYQPPGLALRSKMGSTNQKADKDGKIRIRSITDRSYTPWATIQLPAEAEYGWRQLDLRVTLGISAIKHTGATDADGTYLLESANGSESEDLSLMLSTPRAGARYRQSWMIGGILGSCLFLVTIGLIPLAAKSKTIVA